MPDSILPGSLKTEDEHRRELCTAGRWLHQRGYTPSTDGNISLRLDPRRILSSPTAISFGPIGLQRPFTNDYPAENALVTFK